MLLNELKPGLKAEGPEGKQMKVRRSVMVLQEVQGNREVQPRSLTRRSEGGPGNFRGGMKKSGSAVI